VIDRQALVNKVIAAPGTRPTAQFLPVMVARIYAPTSQQRYLRTGYWPGTAQHCSAAEKRTGHAGALPPSHSVSSTTPHLRYGKPNTCSAILQQTLGIQLIIDKQIFKQKLAKLNSGDFDLALSAWGPDYNDPMTFADLLAIQQCQQPRALPQCTIRSPGDAEAATLPPGAARADTFAAMQTTHRSRISPCYR
jgi:oligopeptide transport system substrate-binding protein